MIVKLLTEHRLEFQSLKGGCRGSSESAHVKMLHCWKSHALVQMANLPITDTINMAFAHSIFARKSQFGRNDFRHI